MPRYTETVLQPPDINPHAGEHEEHTAGFDGETYAMPATAGQLRFWSLDQLSPGNPALNMPLMWRCTGPLHLDAMRQAFTLCVLRHEVLRTTFRLIDGRLSQIIHPPAPMPIPLIDLGDLQAEDRRVRADELTRAHAAYRFDLDHGPLLTVQMLRFDDEHHLLLVSMHHIICDGISNGVLLRDMVAYYEALLSNKEAVLPELPIQFADFAVWQEQWLEGPEPAKSLAFWRESLGNDFSRLNMKRDDDAVAALAERREEWTGDIETLLIPADLQARAHAFCKRENVTLNILLFSIFAALLYRMTGQDDLVIGSPCANRNEDTEELIGLFMNIQVMRLRLSEDETFRKLLTRVQDWTLGAYENQELPFENLVHDAYFSSGSASFEMPIFFLYQKSFMITHNIHGLEIVPLRSESPGAVFEMMFAIVDRAEEGPRLQLEYNPRYFKVSTIQRYLQLYVNLLRSALDQPAARVDQLEILEPAARQQMLVDWNDTARDFGPFAPVHDALMQRVLSAPDKPALVCNGVTWTNRELASYAKRLAARLVKDGLQPGDLVGICVERSPEMLGAVLAVMMAGGAYVPMDPRHPRERLGIVLEDAGATMLLVSRDLNITTTAKVLNLSTAVLEEELAQPVSRSSSSLAYVIYTSGSTGRPKGVAIEHGALLNLLHSMAETPGLGADDVLVAITTLAFDIAALELLLPLLTGALLVIATSAEVVDGRRLLDLLERSQATVMQATPGAWRILIDAGWTNALPLKALCGGEALPRDLADKMLACADQVWNMYGPTETTIWSSATQVLAGTSALRVGPPIANTQFYVLDAHRALVPVGVAGELYIGGQGLARKYWNLPEMTAEKFVANPFGAGRVFATGDLARLRDRGTIELMGRADFQVKVRGYRIELAEIEEVMRRNTQVLDSVVTQQKSDSTGVTRLTGYLAVGTLSGEESDRLIAEVRDLLQAALPDYMIPNAFVTLPALPRNSNGKVDRKALPSADTTMGESGVRSTAAEPEEYAAPSDVLESQLADIWQTTLGIPRISVRSSFFSLGVGSLAALRLITKMNRVYAMDLGLASLISASTIETIAELIRQRFAPNTGSSLVPLQPRGDGAPLFIVHGVGGNVVNFYGLAMRMGTDMPVYGIQSQALVANQPALLRLKDMATHYIADIRKVQPHGPYHLLGYSFGGTVVLEMAHQLSALGEEVSMLGMIDSKSKDYELELARLSPVQSRIQKRVGRFRGNTGGMDLKTRSKYVWDKITTRSIRFACMAAAKLNLRQVPAFMRSAYDINYVAVQNYKPKPYDGRLVLFRASEQDDSRGPYDLGWSTIFAQGVEIRDLTGDHERIFLEPNIDLLATSLLDCLAKS